MIVGKEKETETIIKERIGYSLVILLIFLLWFNYSTLNLIYISILIYSCIIIVILYILIINLRRESKNDNKIFHILLLFILMSFIINIIITFQNFGSFLLIPFNKLIGIKYSHNLTIILVLSSFIIIKLVGVKIYFKRNLKILENSNSDEIFTYFSNNLNIKKSILLVSLIPLSAFVEEFVYRCLFLSLLVYILNWNLIISIIFISIIFGLVHYSSSHNWGHLFSTSLSSIIYCIALIQLGLIYPWLFHLATNLFVILFYYQQRKNELKSTNHKK